MHTELFVDISARYQYNGWFFEAFSQSLEEFTLGYNFYNGDNWAVDLVGLSDQVRIVVDKHSCIKTKLTRVIAGN